MRQYNDTKCLKTGVEPAAITAILIQIRISPCSARTVIICASDVVD